MHTEATPGFPEPPIRFYVVFGAQGSRLSKRGATSASVALSIVQDFHETGWQVIAIRRGTRIITEHELRKDVAAAAPGARGAS